MHTNCGWLKTQSTKAIYTCILSYAGVAVLAGQVKRSLGRHIQHGAVGVCRNQGFHLGGGGGGGGGESCIIITINRYN